ncbi:CocE/NonD family hydrolase, partial [bacterium]|nr:CocE/NonD family hydrolase [bacterium]
QRILPLFILIFFLIPSILGAQETERISTFGKYQGFSNKIYDSWVRSSQYITMRDGTKIAIDILRPKKDGKVEEKPLPVIWSHNRYRRAFRNDKGKLITMADHPHIKPLIQHGYIFASADVRGSGASFGTWQGIFTPEETQDAYEINEWLASQPWCDGNVGMFGGSYLGSTQLMAASTQPPHLKAIFPVVALFDLYEIARHGGVFFDDFIRTWSQFTQLIDTQNPAAPVDGDEDKTLLKAAVEEHQSNRPLIEIFSPLKYRNSKDPVTGDYPYQDWSPSHYIHEINESGIPIYLWGGWFDAFAEDAFLMFDAFDDSKKMVVGVWPHSPRNEELAQKLFNLMSTEALRWFDYWLKGIENGIMEEPPLRYQVMETPEKRKWRTAQKWPLSQKKVAPYYFHQGPSGSISSINDGLLSSSVPNEEGKDTYEVDYTTTSGTSTRWDNAVGGDFGYPDMSENDRKGLTYTTDPLSQDIEITGHPVCHLWVSSTAQNGDFFVYLEEVDKEGVSHYISEGSLRASHRTLHESYYESLKLPYHRSYKKDLSSQEPGKIYELVFDLQPASNVFNKGNRMRVTITCADKDNARTPELSPPPEVTIHRNAEHPSYVLMPVYTPEEAPEAGFPLLIVVFIIVLVVVLVVLFTTLIRKKSS